MSNADAGSLRVEHSDLCLQLHAAIFFVLKFVENVLNRSYIIALQQIEIKTNIRNTVCGMDDAKVTHFNMSVYRESTVKNRAICLKKKLCHKPK